jgi:hypothetical protein
VSVADKLADYYTLIGEEVIPSERSRARTLIQETVEGYFVSTIFLSIPHGEKGGRPLLFETMVLKDITRPDADWIDLDARRYATYQEAQAGHREMVARLKAGWRPDTPSGRQ